MHVSADQFLQEGIRLFDGHSQSLRTVSSLGLLLDVFLFVLQVGNVTGRLHWLLFLPFTGLGHIWLQQLQFQLVVHVYEWLVVVVLDLATFAVW